MSISRVTRWYIFQKIESKICPEIVRWLNHEFGLEVKTKWGHRLDFGKFFGQTLDLGRTKPGHWGQSLDKFETGTKVGQNVDIFRTDTGQILDMDKSWTNSGGPTLRGSTEICTYQLKSIKVNIVTIEINSIEHWDNWTLNKCQLNKYAVLAQH